MIKKIALWIMLSLIIVLIAIQFVRPDRSNISEQVLKTDISNTFNIPDSVYSILKNACYDCHSNNTNYPWYSNIQPVGWLLAQDIKEGKSQINFSEFGSLSKRRQTSKLQGIANQIKDGKMPLLAYRLMHKKAQLTEEQKALLINWSQATKDSISLYK